MTANLPASVLTSNQKKKLARFYSEDGCQYRITLTLRYDDECRNGHNSFAATCWIEERDHAGHWRDYGDGADHEAMAKHFPKYAKYIKWHLVSSDGPMHYLSNTIYHAGDRDHWGLRKGELRQHTSRGKYQNNGVDGVPHWILRIPKGVPTDVYANEKPAPVIIEWEPSGITGEGKERDLDAARSCAVWPEATDEELTAPDLKERLIARLPALMQAFKTDMEELGFIY